MLVQGAGGILSNMNAQAQPWANGMRVLKTGSRYQNITTPAILTCRQSQDWFICLVPYSCIFKLFPSRCWFKKKKKEKSLLGALYIPPYTLVLVFLKGRVFPHGWRLGVGSSWLGGRGVCPGQCRMFSCIPSPHPLDAEGTPHTHITPVKHVSRHC